MVDKETTMNQPSSSDAAVGDTSPRYPLANMQEHAYRADKISHHPDRLETLAQGTVTTPISVKISISDLCNHDCSFCNFRMEDNSTNEWFGIKINNGRQNNPPRMIPTSKVLELLGDMSTMGVHAVEFTGGGEPTAHPEHLRIFEHCLDRGLEAALITNGQLVRPQLDTVLTKFTWIRFSIDAAQAETWGKIRRISPKKFTLVLNNARRLIQHRNTIRSNTHIGAGFVVYEENWQEVYEAVGLFKALGFDSVRISALFNTTQKEGHFHNFGVAASELCERAKNDFEDSNFKVSNNFNTRLNDLMSTGRPTYQRCHYQEIVPYIGGDQNLYRCCNTAYNPVGFLGSLTDISFSLLWDSVSRSKQLHSFRPDKECSICMFNNRNQVIEALLGEIKDPKPVGVIPLHINFV